MLPLLDDLIPPNLGSGVAWTVAIALLWWRIKVVEYRQEKIEDRFNSHIDTSGGGRWQS